MNNKITILILLIFANTLWSTTEVAAPVNDDFANAILISCGNNYIGSTVEATLDEDNAPDAISVDLDAPNIWYSYTGSGITEIVTLNLCASGYDTSYLIYTGTSGNLTLVAANDDNEPQCGAGYRSYGSFQSDGTTTYYITITGYGPTDIGTVDLTTSCLPVTVVLIPDPNFEQALIDLGIEAAENVFLATGQDKIVDWVWVELRDASNSTVIIDGKPALLQRDGDIVDATASNASTPVSFNKASGDYYVVIKHRNHLGIMSNNAFSLSDVVTTVDFTDRNNQITYGGNAQTTFGMPANTVGMWCGNVNGDTVVQYAGTTPDTPIILSIILNDAGNFLNFPTYVVNGYSTNDINMDGITQYAGTTPDTPFILQNVLAHPGNFLNFSTYQIIEQLPENE